MRVRPRRIVVPLLLLFLLALAPGCGREPAATEVHAAAGAAPPTTSPPPADSGASLVDGLTPAELKAVIDAPGSASTRAVTGPYAERVSAGGGTYWRVTIPGSFPVRDARVRVQVGSRQVGEGVVANDLGALVAVSADGRGLTSGAAVSYQWEGSPSTAAGKLVVR